MSDERNGQTGETKQTPPAGSGLFGLFGFADTPKLAGNPMLATVCGLFGLFGWKRQTTPTSLGLSPEQITAAIPDGASA